MLTIIFTPSLRLCLEAKECASYKEAIYDRVQQHFKSQKEVASLKIQTHTKIPTVIILANNPHNIHRQVKELCDIIVYTCTICQLLTNKCVPNSSKGHTFQPDYANSAFKEIEQAMQCGQQFSQFQQKELLSNYSNETTVAVASTEK